jgi:glycosyltransferase involved in cell wall biosynthesis
VSDAARTDRVVVNLTWMLPGVVGGSEDATCAALRAVADLAPTDLALELVVARGFDRAHPDLAQRFPTRELPGAARGRPGRIVAESTWLAAATRGAALVHHAGGTAPPLRTAPYVLTVHDLQPLERDATHGRLKRSYLRVALPRSVAAARLVVTPSEYVRHSVVERFGTDPARVVAVPHSQGHRPDPTSRDVLVDRYRLTGPVILYPSITYPHKNHAVLVRALVRMVDEHPDAVLVLTGGEDAAEGPLRAEIDRLGLRSRVRRTGRVPLPDLMGLFDLAAVVAAPSTYEGFGVYVAEAMSRGTPVVAAAATALPEVVGDAGILVDPHDPEAWAAAMGRVLASTEERERLSRAGRERSARWAPAVVAGALTGAYRRALGARMGPDAPLR